MSEECNLPEDNGYIEDDAPIDQFHRFDYYTDKPEGEGECRECAVCGEPGSLTCMLFIGKNCDGQDLFACGKCCNCSGSED